MMIIKTGTPKLPAFKLTIKGEKEPLQSILTDEVRLEFQLKGNQQVSISWKH